MTSQYLDKQNKNIYLWLWHNYRPIYRHTRGNHNHNNSQISVMIYIYEILQAILEIIKIIDMEQKTSKSAVTKCSGG